MEGQTESHSRSFGLAIHLPTRPMQSLREQSLPAQDLFSRLHHFIRLSSAFIVLPGGIERRWSCSWCGS